MKLSRCCKLLKNVVDEYCSFYGWSNTGDSSTINQITEGVYPWSDRNREVTGNGMTVVT